MKLPDLKPPVFHTWLLSSAVLSGFMFIGFGVLGHVLSWNLERGTPSQMGPGYYPMLVSWGLILVGFLSIAAETVRSAQEYVTAPALRPLVLIFVSLIAFVLLLERVGLVISLAVLICLSAVAAKERASPIRIVLLAIFLIFFAVSVFVFGLNLPLQLWP